MIKRNLSQDGCSSCWNANVAACWLMINILAYLVADFDNIFIDLDRELKG